MSDDKSLTEIVRGDIAEKAAKIRANPVIGMATLPVWAVLLVLAVIFDAILRFPQGDLDLTDGLMVAVILATLALVGDMVVAEQAAAMRACPGCDALGVVR